MYDHTKITVLPSFLPIPEVKLLQLCGNMASLCLAVARGKTQAEIFSLKIRSRLSPLAIDRQSSTSHEPQGLTLSQQYSIKSELLYYQISFRNSHAETP